MKKQIILLCSLTASIVMCCSCGSKPSASVNYDKPLSSNLDNSDINENNTSDASTTFGAVIYQVMENCILVKNVDNQDKTQMYYVSLNEIEAKELQINQCAEITFNGNVLETYPAQISAAKINIVGAADNYDGIIDKKYFNSDIKPVQIIKLDDVLYYNTYKESDLTGRCGMMDGYIDKTVSKFESPVENNQSNFGTDYQYQRVDDGNVDVCIDGKFIRFKSIV